MATATKTAKPKKKRTVEQVKRELDAAIAKHDPAPERVLVAILGWRDGIVNEFNRVRGLLKHFNLTGEHWEYRPGFAFLNDVYRELETAEEALDEFPRPEMRSGAELEVEIVSLLPKPMGPLKAK